MASSKVTSSFDKGANSWGIHTHTFRRADGPASSLTNAVQIRCPLWLSDLRRTRAEGRRAGKRRRRRRNVNFINTLECNQRELVAREESYMQTCGRYVL